MEPSTQSTRNTRRRRLTRSKMYRRHSIVTLRPKMLAALLQYGVLHNRLVIYLIQQILNRSHLLTPRLHLTRMRLTTFPPNHFLHHDFWVQWMLLLPFNLRLPHLPLFVAPTRLFNLYFLLIQIKLPHYLLTLLIRVTRYFVYQGWVSGLILEVSVDLGRVFDLYQIIWSLTKPDHVLVNFNGRVLTRAQLRHYSVLFVAGPSIKHWFGHMTSRVLRPTCLTAIVFLEVGIVGLEPLTIFIQDHDIRVGHADLGHQIIWLTIVEFTVALHLVIIADTLQVNILRGTTAHMLQFILLHLINFATRIWNLFARINIPIAAAILLPGLLTIAGATLLNTVPALLF